MNKRELEISNFIKRRYQEIAPKYACPNDIIVKEDKKNNRFEVTEVWNLGTPNKPFNYIRNLFFNGKTGAPHVKT